MGSALSVIRANVRRNLGETTPNFYTNAELNQYIGEAYQYYSMIMLDEGEGYFETHINLGFTSGSPYISVDNMTPPFYTISKLERWLSNSSSVPLRLNERRFKINTTIAVSTGDAYRPTYNQQGMSIVIEPTPTSTEAPASTGQVSSGLLLWYNYIPTFPVSNSADGFTFDSCFPIIWEPMIQLFATIRAMEGKDAMGGVSDISTFRETLGTWESRFMDSLERDETPESVEQMGMDYSWNIFSGGF
jgi:hypothetical protein